jgi:death-on-curing family protein
VTVYLTPAQIIVVNASLDGGVGVRDHGALEHLAFRPKTVLFDQHMFPTVWLKAAAYMEGFATHQVFSDGNKRTAWLVSQMFLDANGYELPDMPDIESETFAQAVAHKVFNTDEEPDLTLAKAAEWFEMRWRTARAGASQDFRVEYVFLALDVQRSQGMPIYVGADVYGIVTATMPRQFKFWVIGIVHRDPNLAEATEISAVIYPADGGPLDVDDPGSGVLMPPRAPSTNPNHLLRGLSPTTFHIPLEPTVKRPGPYVVVVRVDGDIVGGIRFHVEEVDPDVTDEKLRWLVQ